MSRIRTDKPLVPSVLDRLLDDRPQDSRETQKSQNQVLAEMRQSVRRDLERLLNTRTRCMSWPAELTELARSLVAYGIPDITGADLQTQRGKRDYLTRIERTIRQFEPRFKTVRVLPLDNADFTDRTFRFRIEAMMYAYPAPEPVVFDSALEPVSGNVSVKGSSR